MNQKRLLHELQTLASDPHLTPFEVFQAWVCAKRLEAILRELDRRKAARPCLRNLTPPQRLTRPEPLRIPIETLCVFGD
jgi:hypothetical protein